VRIIRDAVWGDIRLTEEEYRVANCYEVLRLNRLRQLHLCYTVYPSATHTRYSHSLGTLYLAKRVVSESELPLSSEDARLLYLAALLHDVGHAAFGHVLEPTIPGLRTHEEMRQSILDGSIVDRYVQFGLLSEPDRRRIEGEESFVALALSDETRDELGAVFSGHRPWVSEIFDHLIDVDTLDYLARDSWALGLLPQAYDRCILSAFRLEPRSSSSGEELGVVFASDDRVFAALEDVIFSRWFLFRNAYLHPTVMAANAMLVDSIIRGGIPAADLDLAYLLGEDELLERIATCPSPDAAGLARRILSRHLYKPAYVINTLGAMKEAPAKSLARAQRVHRDQTFLGQFINAAAEQTGLTPLVGFPLIPPEKNYADLQLSGGAKLGDVMDLEVSIYQARYAQLANLYVYSPDSSPAARAKLESYCTEFFGTKGGHMRSAGLEAPAAEGMLRRAIEELTSRHPRSARVLIELANGEPATLGMITERTGLKKPTVSAHLKEIERTLNRFPIAVVQARVDRRVKEWWIRKPELRQVVREVIGAES